MRILMISDVFFPRINGVSTSIKLFRQTLIAMGHEVTLIAPDYGDQEQEEDIYRIPSRKVILDPEDRMMSRRAVLDLIPVLRTKKFDVLHIHTPFVAHYVGVRLARELGIPCVETYHTFFEEYLYHYFPYVPRGWMRALARVFTRRQCNSVDAVITPSTAMRDVLSRYGVMTRTDIIPTGLELNELKSGDGERFRKKYGIKQDRKAIVHVGRVAHEKNIGFLLEMLVHLCDRQPDVLLIIAGEGPALVHLKQETVRLGLTEHVMFIGYLDRDGELLDCYCAGEAFVFASRTETQGLVLLEAMALGVPVVSTAVMGTRDILEPRRGALVSVEEPLVFSETVFRLLENSFLRQRLAKEARVYVREWTAPIMAERLISFYESVLNGQSQKTDQKEAITMENA
jgi:1,2-diacylglycerol 3-alpha-glucosyltransferase